MRFRFSPSNARLAAMILLVVASATSPALAQTLSTNLFGGTNAPNPDALSVAGAVTSTQTTGPFGPSYNGTVSLGAGAAVTLTETMNANAAGTYAIGETGTVGASGSFSANKTFAGSSLLAGQYYQLTLTKSAASAVSLLSSFNIQLTTTNNGTTFVALDTTTNTGLLGAINVLNLFGTSNTAAIPFQVPTNFPTTAVTVNFSGGVSASGVNSTFTFVNANVLLVPEPSTWTLLGLGGASVVVLWRRQRVA